MAIVPAELALSLASSGLQLLSCFSGLRTIGRASELRCARCDPTAIDHRVTVNVVADRAAIGYAAVLDARQWDPGASQNSQRQQCCHGRLDLVRVGPKCLQR